MCRDVFCLRSSCADRAAALLHIWGLVLLLLLPLIAVGVVMFASIAYAVGATGHTDATNALAVAAYSGIDANAAAIDIAVAVAVVADAAAAVAILMLAMPAVAACSTCFALSVAVVVLLLHALALPLGTSVGFACLSSGTVPGR